MRNGTTNPPKPYIFATIANLAWIFGLQTDTHSYEKKMYIGCYSNSKQYIGSKAAKNYCLCTINMLSKKFSDEEMDFIFKKTPKEIMEATEFASIHCENTK